MGTSNEIKLGITVEGGDKAIATMDAITQTIKKSKDLAALEAQQAKQFTELKNVAIREELELRKLANLQTQAQAIQTKRVSDLEKNGYDGLLLSLRTLDLQRRQGNITVDAQTRGLINVIAQSEKLNLTQAQQITIQEKVFQVNSRTASGFNSMGTSLGQLNKNTNTANQTLIGFSQGMQDASQFSMGFNQGLRGIANNIQQTTQMFGLLYQQTGSVKASFSLLASSLMSPAGLLIGLAGITTILQVLPSLFKSTADSIRPMNELLKEQSELLFKLGKATRDDREVFLLGQIGKAELNLNEKTPKILDYKATVVARNQDPNSKYVYRTVGTPQEILDLTNSLNKAKLELKEFYDLINKQDEKSKKKSDGSAYANRPEKMDFTYASKGTIAKLKDVDDLKRVKDSDPFALIGMPNGMVKFAKDVTFLEFELSRPLKGVNAGKPDSDWMKPINDKDLKDSAHQYDMLLFDPIKQGFSDINSAIRTQLFGTLDALKEKFGAIGASIIQALESVIAKLIETALIAGLVSLITGGGAQGLSFLQAFKGLSGGASAGSLITDPLKFKASGGTLGDGMTMVGEQGAEMIYKRGNSAYVYNNKQTNRMASNMMGGGGMQKIQVQVVGKIGNDAIYIAGQRYKSLENTSLI